MGFYNDAQNRFILLIEELRVALISGVSVRDATKYFADHLDRFDFLKKAAQKIGEGQDLNTVLNEQAEKESSKKVKDFLRALTAGDFAPQKLEELREALVKERKENFEEVSSSAMSRIGWLATAAIIPIGIYFMGSMAEVFKEVELSGLVVTDSVKIGVLGVCAVIYVGLMFFKRLKNG